VVEAEVDTTGRVRATRVLSGHKLLTDAALEAVSQWRYRPLLLNGEPTAFILTVNVEFKLRRG
jgi:periplasmic protein TonB